MALQVLLSTSRVSAEATVERLVELGLDAQVLDHPNVFVKLASGGNYRVRVAVPEEELERARAEIQRWADESEGRVRGLAQEVQRVLVGAGVLGLVVGGGGAALGVVRPWLWGLASWAGWLLIWTLRSRRRYAKGASS